MFLRLITTQFTHQTTVAGWQQKRGKIDLNLHNVTICLFGFFIIFLYCRSNVVLLQRERKSDFVCHVQQQESENVLNVWELVEFRKSLQKSHKFCCYLVRPSNTECECVLLWQNKAKRKKVAKKVCKMKIIKIKWWWWSL